MEHNQGNRSSRLLEALERDMLVSLLEPKTGDRMLEVGCGSGKRLHIFRNRGLDVTGLESDPALVTAARKCLGHDSMVEFGEPGDLPFEDNSFELVLLSHVLTGTSDPCLALAEAGRVARKRVVVATFNSCSLQALWEWLQDGPDIGRRFSPWRLNGMARQVYGPSRIRRVTLLTFPKPWLPRLKAVETSPLVQRFPWGALLFLRIDLGYTVRTRPLTVPAKPAAWGSCPGPLRRGSAIGPVIPGYWSRRIHGTDSPFSTRNREPVRPEAG